MKRIILIWLAVSLFTFAQSKDPIKIINEVKARFDKIQDYEVDVNIKLDFSMVKIPETNAKLYFKQPDKVKVDSKGFAMLPKQSLSFSPAQFLQGDFTTIFVKSEIVNGNKLDVIKIIPNSDSTDVVLSTLWIDQIQKVISKIETTGKKSGTINVELTYENKTSVLPSSVIFSFNLGNMPIHDETANDKEDQKQNRNRSRQNMSMSGKVFMTYTNYKINKGIPDSFFEEKKN